MFVLDVDDHYDNFGHDVLRFVETCCCSMLMIIVIILTIVGKNVIYHQDLGYLILGLRILDPENFAAKYLSRISGSLILRIEDPQSSESRILNPQDLGFLILGF